MKIFLTITDNAGGINEELLSKVFLQHFTTKCDEGSGIGLHMSKRILEKIDATISVQNVETGYGKGASFTISI